MRFQKAISNKQKAISKKDSETYHLSLITYHFKVKHAFTLIELLIVISIIGILITIGIFSFDNARQKGRDLRRKQDLGAIKSALILYYQDNKKFPATVSELMPTYINQLPQDSLQQAAGNDCAKTHVYCYVLNTDGTFVLWAQLENSKDQQIIGKASATCSSKPPSPHFNYCLSSPSL